MALGIILLALISLVRCTEHDIGGDIDVNDDNDDGDDNTTGNDDDNEDDNEDNEDNNGGSSHDDVGGKSSTAPVNCAPLPSSKSALFGKWEVKSELFNE